MMFKVHNNKFIEQSVVKYGPEKKNKAPRSRISKHANLLQASGQACC